MIKSGEMPQIWKECRKPANLPENWSELLVSSSENKNKCCDGTLAHNCTN